MMTNQNSEEIKDNDMSLINENAVVENTKVEETTLIEENLESKDAETMVENETLQEETLIEETVETITIEENNEQIEPTVEPSNDEVVEEIVSTIEENNEQVEPTVEPSNDKVVEEIVSTIEENNEQIEPTVEPSNDEVAEETVSTIEENFDELILEDTNQEESEDVEIHKYSELTNEKILEKLRYLVYEAPIEKSKKLVDVLKNQYYKNLKNQFETEKQKLIEETGEHVELEMPKDINEEYLKELMNDYRQKKFEHHQQQELEKTNNLKLKLEIIEKIKGLANSEETLNKTFIEFKELQKQWLEIGPVPNNEASSLWKSYQFQIEKFYDLVKIEKDLRDLDLRRNLEKKIELCEKAEELLLEEDAIIAHKKLQELHVLWKEHGPVPGDKREEIWDRFLEASRKIRKAYQEFSDTLKEERENNYKQKLEICEKLEAILNENIPQNGKEWIKSSEEVLELQKTWKTIGMVPNAVNVEIYDRFKIAGNKFFDAKKEFYNTMNEDLNTNLQKKIELCVNAELIQSNTNDWKKTTEMMLDLQRKWKEIGAVPKKNSEQIWQRFRAACDVFFNAKSAFFSNIETEQKENFEKKEQLIFEIKNYVPTANQAENIENLQTFQTRWTEIGFVASSERQRLYDEYKKAINAIYDKIDLKNKKIFGEADKSVAEAIKGNVNIDKLSSARVRILRKIEEREAEIMQIENNLSFFSSGSSSIVEEFRKKIEKIKDDIKALKEQKKQIDLTERELKNKEKEQNEEQSNP